MVSYIGRGDECVESGLTTGMHNGTDSLQVDNLFFNLQLVMEMVGVAALWTEYPFCAMRTDV
jgi:hypothetical protein